MSSCSNGLTEEQCSYVRQSCRWDISGYAYGQPLQIQVENDSQRTRVREALEQLDVGQDFLRFSQDAEEKLQHGKISQGDHIKQIDGRAGPGHELLAELLAKLSLNVESLEPFTITVYRPTMTRQVPITTLRQLKSPMKPGEFPTPTNSTFFGVTSTDGSIILSVRGVEMQSAGGGKVHHQLWAGPHPANMRFMDGFKHKKHVFMIFVSLDQVWGIARMMSPADRDSYGSHEAWCWDEGDLPHWAWLAENMKIQWLKECLQPLEDCPSLCIGLPSDQGGRKLPNGVELDTAEAWRDAEKLMQCPDAPHALREPCQKLPPDSARRYLRYAKGPDYNPRENVDCKLTGEQSELQDATTKK